MADGSVFSVVVFACFVALRDELRTINGREAVDKILTNKTAAILEMKAILSTLSVVTLYKVPLTFVSVDEILNCDHSTKVNENYFSMLAFVFRDFANLFGFFQFEFCALARVEDLTGAIFFVRLSSGKIKGYHC